MSKSYKFGMFAGVFTPSILTILGVIMYLRLGWVVGQVGLLGAIGIILAAHVISVSTGLSVSSIATDKKVKAGGAYYIISRSLGLSIGGALGIALYVGMAASVALYIIGFSENFNAYNGWGTDTNDLRLTGTAILFCVTALAVWSTSLALKAQYPVLTAIVLSLIAIAIGTHDYTPVQGVEMMAPPSGEPLALVFGIFFPAVTGFTAGLAMSGDLKDPTRAIPVGTMLAVACGLVVYLVMAAFLAYTVDGEMLRNDYQILEKIAWTPVVMGYRIPLVNLGIWAATLSSALGSILGAPRILQTLSVDNVTPKIFKKGVGPGNEPRNALIFTALLAELGILIGELDLIARIVSMFFMTTYGFLNLTCVIESWASPDFRPQFKIPTWVSTIGAVACFFIMIQLDVLAMIGSTLVMFAIFFYLSRKELGTEVADVWAGVWFSLVKSGLFKLNQGDIHKRNWQPNMLLFSGRPETRPHLIDFGKWLAKNRGVLSVFDLSEEEKAKNNMPKSQQAMKPEGDEFTGYFSRRLDCRDVYEGMDMIARCYGFSGMEPNTVLMGWARNSKNPDKFANLVRLMADLDYNVMLLDYDQRIGFGKKAQIDIWWRGAGNNIALGLMLVKFLKTSDDWRQTEVRILIVLDESGLGDKVTKNMNQVLEEYRIHAEVKIINNAIERRGFYDLIKIESVDSDLTIIGLPEVTPSRANQFVANTNRLLHEIGTVLMTRASSYFEEIYVGIDAKVEEEEQTLTAVEGQLPDINFPRWEIPAHPMIRLQQSLESTAGDYYDRFMKDPYGIDLAFVERIGELINRKLAGLERRLSADAETLRNQKAVAKSLSNFLFQSTRILNDYKDKKLVTQKEIAEEGVTWILERLEELIGNAPEQLKCPIAFDDLPQSIDESPLRRLALVKGKAKARLRGSDHFLFEFNYRHFVRFYLETKGVESVLRTWEEFALDSNLMISKLQNIFERVKKSLNGIERSIDAGQFEESLVAGEREALLELVSQLKAVNTNRFSEARFNFKVEMRELIQTMSDQIELLQTTPGRAGRKRLERALSIRERIMLAPGRRHHNQTLLVNMNLMDLTLLTLQSRLRSIVTRSTAELIVEIQSTVLDTFPDQEKPINDLIQNVDELPFNLPTEHQLRNIFSAQLLTDQMLAEIQKAVERLPESVVIMSEDALNILEAKKLQEADSVNLSFRRLVAYLLEVEFVRPLREEVGEAFRVLRDAVGSARDALVLLTINLSDMETDTIGGDSSAAIQEGIERIREAYGQVESVPEQINHIVDHQLLRTFEKLNPYYIARSSESLGQYMMAQSRSRITTTNNQGAQVVQNYVGNVLAQVWSRRSRGVLMARRFSRKKLVAEPLIDQLLTLAESISPPPKVLGTMPFYYKQLFIGSHSANDEFWIDLPDETTAARRAHARYLAGNIGGLLILGEAKSGKTALSTYLASRFFGAEKMFVLDPPRGGSINPLVFKNSLESVLNVTGDYADIFAGLPGGSVLVLNDLELWWERSRDGFAVLDIIVDLMARYGHKCFFIVNSGIFGYRFLNKVHKIEDNFLDILHCRSLDSDGLRELILLRHRSTGLKFSLDGRGEDQFGNLRAARLFSDHFNYSKGRIGVALQAWLANIRHFGGDYLEIGTPKTPDTSLLESLEKDWVLLIIQFVLHKRITIDRLVRITQREEQELRALTALLKRGGILVESGDGIWEINPYLDVHITERFSEMGVL